MSNHMSSIIYHAKYLLPIKEKLYMNLSKVQKRKSAQAEGVLNIRNRMTNHCEIMLHSDMTSIRKTNLQKMKDIIEQSAHNVFTCLLELRSVEEWLYRNISKSDPVTLNKWFEISHKGSSYEKTFELCMSTFLKVSRLFVEMLKTYKKLH